MKISTHVFVPNVIYSSRMMSVMRLCACQYRCMCVCLYFGDRTNEYERTDKRTNEWRKRTLGETMNWKIVQRATFSGAIVRNILFHDIIIRELYVCPYVCRVSQTNMYITHNNSMCLSVSFSSVSYILLLYCTARISSAELWYAIFMGPVVVQLNFIWSQRHLRAYVKRKRKIRMTEKTWTLNIHK